MLKFFVVILIGIAVGVAIELVLARRQRARRVVLDPLDLGPGAGVDLYGGVVGRDRGTRGSRVPDAPDSMLVFDDDGGFRILGPVEHDDSPDMPWDAAPVDRADAEAAPGLAGRVDDPRGSDDGR